MCSMRTVAGSRLEAKHLGLRFAFAKLDISTEKLWVLTPAPVALLNPSRTSKRLLN
jgi:hypothetical protein